MESVKTIKKWKSLYNIFQVNGAKETKGTLNGTKKTKGTLNETKETEGTVNGTKKIKETPIGTMETKGNDYSLQDMIKVRN